jgi:mRNA interferase MazF
MADLGNVIGPAAFAIYFRYREHADRRPCVILSNDRFNASAAELVIAVPMTSSDKAMPTHVRIDPPEGGIRNTSFVICEGIRSVARQYLLRRLGVVTPQTMTEIELRLRDLMNF